MKRFLRGVLIWFVALVGGVMVAHAHDPMSSWVVIHFTEDRMELSATLAPIEAKYLLPDVDPTKIVITPENFEDYEQAFTAAAGVLFAMRVADEEWKPLSSEAFLTAEEDIEFRAVYRRPEKGPFFFSASFLQQMSPEHVCFVSILDDTKHLVVGYAPTADEPDSVLAVVPRLPQPSATAPAENRPSTPPTSG